MIFADIKNPKIRSKFVRFWSNELKDSIPDGPEKTLCWRALQTAYWQACQAVTVKNTHGQIDHIDDLRNR